ncbi:MAG: hypothetical protein LQ343_006355 [Gyalolechia ehrenbergii]|nr:MAG: hypothetical protein LQ343_006355 [Gyalolechia ehrenbergii]
MLALASFGPTSIMMFGLPSTALIWVGSSLAGSWVMLAGNEYKARQARAKTTPNELEIFGHPLPRGQLATPDPARKSVGSAAYARTYGTPRWYGIWDLVLRFGIETKNAIAEILGSARACFVQASEDPSTEVTAYKA